MKGYSVDLRERVAAAVLENGLTWVEAARLFRLSVASVGRFVRAGRLGRDLTPGHSSGRPRRLDSAEKLDALRAQLAAEPDLTLVERGERLRQQHGITVSEPTLSRLLRHVFDWRHKKNQPPRQRAGRGRTGGLARASAGGGGSRNAGLCG
jgi:putative transposase